MGRKKCWTRQFPKTSQTTKFRGDLKRMLKQGRKLEKLELVIQVLICGQTLDQRYRDHKLQGKWQGHRECHITPDWLIIYRVTSGGLHLVRSGSHSCLLRC